MWKTWDELIISVAWKIFYATPLTISQEITCTATHSIAIDINRIDRIGHAERVIETKDVANITGIALGTVINKDLITLKGDATWSEIVGNDGVLQERVAMLRTVSTEGIGRCHLLDGLMQSLYNCRTKWLSDVTNTKTDDVGFWMFLLKSSYLLSNGRKEVA